MVEASAAAAAYALIVECFVTRDLHPWRDLPGVLLKGGVLVGAVLILLASAMGLTSYLVDAQIPDQLLAPCSAHVTSPLVFLLVLNVFLLVLGSVLEIYSAIVVLTPLVVPLGVAFGIDPVHLGVIFLANLELGFLFPPVGLNLFLSASRFGTPDHAAVPRSGTVPLILGGGVLLITYVASSLAGSSEASRKVPRTHPVLPCRASCAEVTNARSQVRPSRVHGRRIQPGREAFRAGPAGAQRTAEGASGGSSRARPRRPHRVGVPLPACAVPGSRSPSSLPLEPSARGARSDLHTCSNCIYFDTSCSNECRKPVIERVVNKIKRNTCELFTPGSRAGVRRRAAAPDQPPARRLRRVVPQEVARPRPPGDQ